ncbi:MAG: 2-polyprenylphenol 6-hydroxylase [Pseudomonadota bacterium]
MFAAIADYLRLARAGFALARYDALFPKEYADAFPAPLRLLGTVSRIGAKRRENGVPLSVGARLARGLEAQGPAYIKLGQFLATRPDIIGFDIARSLSRLQDALPAFPQEEAVREIEKSLGRPVAELFGEFGPPVAAASIAQVHKATTADGRTVAVKILRPRIERTVAREFRAFARGARLVERLAPAARRLEPQAFVGALRESAEFELDLRMEAAGASELKEGLSADPNLRVPEVIWPLSSRRVLTLQWIDGAPLTNPDAVAASGADRQRLARAVIEAFLKQALGESGFFHADMHQGNLLADEAGRLVLLDFGITGRLDDDAKRYLAEILYAFLNRDYARGAAVHFEAGYVPKTFAPARFAQALRAVGEPVFGAKAEQVDMSRLLQQLFDVTALFDMHLRPELVLLQRTMVTVEGVARELDPKVDMWETARPIVEGFMTDRLGPRARLRAAREAALTGVRLLDRAPGLAVAAERIAAGAAADPDGFADRFVKPAAPARPVERGSSRALWAVAAGLVLLAAAVALAGL